MKYVPPINGAEDDAYVDASPATGVEGSAVPAAAIEHPLREIIKVITTAGLTPNGEDLTQLAAAIATMIEDAAQDLSGLVASTRSIATTGALSGGGDLSADRTLTVRAATTALTGVLALSTTAAVLAGAETGTAVDPAGLAARLAALLETVNAWTAAQAYTPVSLSISSGVVAWDMSAAPVAVLTLSEDVTAINVTNAVAGSSCELTIIQDATGGRTVTWPAAWRWPGGSAPDVTSDAGGEDLLLVSVRSGMIRACAAQAFAEVS